MDRLQTDLREFVELLLEKKIDFVVVGAYAVAFHGHPRYTRDIDFLVRSTPESAERLTLLINEFGFGALQVKETDFYNPELMIQLGYEPNRIDILTQIDGLTFEEVWNTKVEGFLDGLPVFFIDLKSLIRNKSATGRPKDGYDVEALKELWED